jgi:hypothetical protein
MERPEAKIQEAIIKFLRNKEWWCRHLHGNTYQTGFPDLFCTHAKYGHRFVEVKNPLAYRFTAAQMEVFPQICANGSGVWVMVAATEDEYLKLFKSPNWYAYLKL